MSSFKKISNQNPPLKFNTAVWFKQKLQFCNEHRLRLKFARQHTSVTIFKVWLLRNRVNPRHPCEGPGLTTWVGSETPGRVSVTSVAWLLPAHVAGGGYKLPESSCQVTSLVRADQSWSGNVPTLSRHWLADTSATHLWRDNLELGVITWHVTVTQLSSVNVTTVRIQVLHKLKLSTKLEIFITSLFLCLVLLQSYNHCDICSCFYLCPRSLLNKW